MSTRPSGGRLATLLAIIASVIMLVIAPQAKLALAANGYSQGYWSVYYCYDCLPSRGGWRALQK